MDLYWRETVLSDVFDFMVKVGQKDHYSRSFLTHGQAIVENLQKMDHAFPGTYDQTLQTVKAMVAYVEEHIRENSR